MAKINCFFLSLIVWSLLKAMVPITMGCRIVWIMIFQMFFFLIFDQLFIMLQINVLTVRLKWWLLFWQVRESMSRQMLHKHLAIDAHTIQFSDWPKLMLGSVTLRYFPPFVGPNVISHVPTDWLWRHQLTYQQNLKWGLMPDKMAGKHVTSNIASSRNQWYSKDSFFWLARMTYVMA